MKVRFVIAIRGIFLQGVAKIEFEMIVAGDILVNAVEVFHQSCSNPIVTKYSQTKTTRVDYPSLRKCYLAALVE